MESEYPFLTYRVGFEPHRVPQLILTTGVPTHCGTVLCRRAKDRCQMNSAKKQFATSVKPACNGPQET